MDNILVKIVPTVSFQKISFPLTSLVSDHRNLFFAFIYHLYIHVISSTVLNSNQLETVIYMKSIGSNHDWEGVIVILVIW